VHVFAICKYLATSCIGHLDQGRFELCLCRDNFLVYIYLFILPFLHLDMLNSSIYCNYSFFMYQMV
jgi:hypothetical protein